MEKKNVAILLKCRQVCVLFYSFMLHYSCNLSHLFLSIFFYGLSLVIVVGCFSQLQPLIENSLESDDKVCCDRNSN